MANQKKDEGGGGGSSKVGSLLTDLLNDVKQSVDQERGKIEAESDRRAREEREAREREEGRRRAEAQQKLIEETRRRNEALSRQRGESERRLATAPHMRPLGENPKTGPKSAELSVAVQAAPQKKLILAALVVIGIGIGLGSAFALTPSPHDSGPIDVSAAARAVVAATRKQATAEQKAYMELEAARKQIADLQRDVGEAKGAHKSLETQLAVLKSDFEKTRDELNALRGASGTKRGTGTTGNGIPNINGSIFNK